MPQAFSYDLDGNLLQDGLSNYEWDADEARQRGDGAPKARPQGCRVRVPAGRTRQQNRLIAQELRSDVSTVTWKRLEYSYDSQSRRVRKLVKTRATAGGTWTTASDTRFLYDGWNLIAEYSYASSIFTLLCSHAWGLDLSGSQQGAGGVGGLLWTTVASTSKTYLAAADANGNVIAYVDSADGSIAGKRDYGALGEAVLTTGVAGSLPFGFSSKYEEKETGFCYYGFRYYNPSTGRWPNRDFIEEDGGLNLFLMVKNDPVSYYDILGLMIPAAYPASPGNTYPLPLTTALFSHYIGRSGTVYRLKKQDIEKIRIEHPLDFTEHSGVLAVMFEVASDYRTRRVTFSMNAYDDYHAGDLDGDNSLGAFKIRPIGEVSCVNTSNGIGFLFKGQFRVEDRYDGENKNSSHRTDGGNKKTVILGVTPGVNFEVVSEWIDVEQMLNPVQAPEW